MINELVSLIGSLHLRPVKSAQPRSRKSKKTQHVDTRKTTVKRVGYTGIEAISAGRHIVVADLRRLGQPVVPESCFIHPLVGWGIDVVESKHLRPRMNQGQPFGL